MLLISQLKLAIPQKHFEEEQALLEQIEKRLHIRKKDVASWHIVKKSLDARKKPQLFWVYNIAVELCEAQREKELLKRVDPAISTYQPVIYRLPVCDVLSRKTNHIFSQKTGDALPRKLRRPVVVGTGPAGLFCGYMLACSGLCPIMIERGKPVEQRIKTVNDFWKNNVLDPDTNIQFGEGGAGTFSDGKLQTQIKDKTGRIHYILSVLVEHGAPEEILYLNKPHVGTERLAAVVSNLRKHMIALGAEFHFETRMTELCLEKERLKGIRVADQKGTHVIETEHCVLCIGHSARETFLKLYEQGIKMVNKPFAVGLRVQHRQNMINEIQYGDDWEKKELPQADYKLTYQTCSGRGIYSFCMCPGGYVVNASSEPERIAVNGMSYHDRDSGVANSAIVVTIDNRDYGLGVFDGMFFQQELEHRAYVLGQGKIALQRWKHYCVIPQKDEPGNAWQQREEEFSLKDVFKETQDILTPRVKGQYLWTDIRGLLPETLYLEFVEAVKYFGTQMKGFDHDDMIVCGIESRTSSPVKLLRDSDSLQSNIAGLFPCGEGAGYAGGITSAALDGVKVAEKVILLYNNTQLSE